jgi:DNA helicase II / ATP-dependent DNA helicase PcrA
VEIKKYTLKGYTPKADAPVATSHVEGLNPAQVQAVTTTEGPVLVIAGAGSGKTKTLVHRVAHLIDKGVSPSSILLMTFTRKSAQNMLRRASLIGDRRSESVTGGTFHSFAHMILRQEGHLLGYRNGFTILDKSDAEDLIAGVRADMGAQKSDKRFPQKGTLADIFGKHVNMHQTIDQIVGKEYPQFSEFSERIEKMFAAYTATKRRLNVLDYDDLLTELQRLLVTESELCLRLRQRFRYVMVDEYQDTNLLQADIVERLVGPGGNIMVVGDDAQSIYAFRGADIRNMTGFHDRFPDAVRIMLAENYRSYQPILNLTNAVISKSRETFDKQLFTSREGGQLPVFVDMADIYMQSAFIVQRIQELHEDGIPLSEMAVLFRSGFHSNDVELALHAAGLPFQKFGGFKFIESAHVKDIMAFLRVLQNPSDTVSWNRVLMMFDGLGQKTASDVSEQLVVAFQNESEVLPNAPLSEGLFAETGGIENTKLTEDDRLYQVFFQFAGRRFGSELLALASHMSRWASIENPSLVLADVLAYFKPLFEKRYDDAKRREPDFDTLLHLAAKHDDMSAFVSELLIDPPQMSQVDASATGSESDVLTLSTIHSSKGLEWKVVFILSLVDGYLPSFQAMGDMRQLEEERRLLYVAMTRASEQLYLLKPNVEAGWGQRIPGMVMSRPSRFLMEALMENSGLLERWSLTPETEMPAPDFADMAEPSDPFDSRDSGDKPKRYGF